MMIGEEDQKMLKLKKRVNKKKNIEQGLENKQNKKITIKKMKRKNKNLKKNLNILKLISLILLLIQHLKLGHKEAVEVVVIEVVEEAIRMREMAVKDKIIIEVEVAEDILIGIITTMVKEGLSIEEVIEGVVVEIITKHQMIQKLLEKREKNK